MSCSSSSLSGISIHTAIAMNDSPSAHRRICGSIDAGHERTGRARERMVRERGDENAEHDRHGLAIAGRENECEELGFVTDLGQRNDARRYQEGFE